MKVTYYEDEDTLVIRRSDKAITREVSQDWYTHVSCAADGTVVEIVLEVLEEGRDRDARAAEHPGAADARGVALDSRA